MDGAYPEVCTAVERDEVAGASEATKRWVVDAEDVPSPVGSAQLLRGICKNIYDQHEQIMSNSFVPVYVRHLPPHPPPLNATGVLVLFGHRHYSL